MDIYRGSTTLPSVILLVILFERGKVDFEEISQTLLVGIQISTITVEYGMKSPLKLNNRNTIQAMNLTYMYTQR